MPDYKAKSLGQTVGGVLVGVFDGNRKVGEYVRNYPHHAEATFFPFEQGARWFALYSPHYTATRVMSLPDCKDLGGEESSASGFCPVEYLVPRLTGRVFNPADPRPVGANHDAARWAHQVPVEVGGKQYTRLFWPDDPDHPAPDPVRREAFLAERERSHRLYREWDARNPFVTRHARWGLVHGCQWGSPYWVRFIDLSRAAEGVLAIDDRFGALELPARVSLAEAVECDPEWVDGPAEDCVVNIASPKAFDLSGKSLD